MCHGMKVVREGQRGGKIGQVVEGGKADCVKVRWDWDSFSGAMWRVISNESIGTKEGGYNLVFSSCGKNGGKVITHLLRGRISRYRGGMSSSQMSLA